jgi:hypothetical protein
MRALDQEESGAIRGAIKWTRLSCRTFAANAVRLQLHALAYNLGNFLRTLATPEPIVSVLHEGRENANIYAGLGFIWRIPDNNRIEPPFSRTAAMMKRTTISMTWADSRGPLTNKGRVVHQKLPARSIATWKQSVLPSYHTNCSSRRSRTRSQYLLAHVGIQLFLFVGAWSTSRAEELLLSKSDKGYEFIETLQKHYCTKRPSHNCRFDSTQCKSQMTKLWREMFGELLSNEQATTSCAQVSTQFELPGIHKLLQDLNATVRAVAPFVGLDVVDGLRFGSLPIRDINARVLPPDPALGHFVLFNIRFFEFASELAKVAALHIPMKVEGETLAIDGSQQARDQRIHDDPELRFLFVNRLVHFLDLEGLKPVLPPKDIQPILARYQEGIELFAMAHEYSHIALRHVGPTAFVEGIDVDAISLGISGQKADWIQELEADYFAAKILRAATDQKLVSADRAMTDFMMPLTAEFYFLSRHIVADAIAILFGDGEKSEATPDENRLLDVALRCIAAQQCNLASALNQQPSIPIGHPHPSIRRTLVRNVLTKRPSNDTDSAMQALASQMIRNVEYLWSEVEGALRSPEAAGLIESIRKAKSERLSK